jgi:hypothetical protein
LQNLLEKLNKLGADFFNSILTPDQLPENKEELELHMQLDYKQAVEIAEEEAINNVLDFNNKYEIELRKD